MSAIYALVAVSMVLIFTVTRILYMPQGDFLSYGAMTLAALQLGHVPQTLWIVVGLYVLLLVVDTISLMRRREWHKLPKLVMTTLAYPAVLVVATLVLAPLKLPILIQAVLAVMLVAPIGPVTYQLVFRPIAQASVLTLLFASVALHFALLGAALVMFGAEVAVVSPFVSTLWEFGEITVSAQSVFVVMASVISMVGLYVFFEYTLHGKALRATAINHLGAELVGISAKSAGILTLWVASIVGALAGILAAPIAPIYYDTGFFVGLRAIVAAIFGGMVSYPLAAAGAVLVGLIESFSSFWDSSFKEVIVFTLILPVLLWRSLATSVIENDEQDDESAA